MIKMFQVRMSDYASEGVVEALLSGMIGEGPKTVEFKQKLEERFHCKNLILLNSGTSALTLALRLAGIEPPHQVITTPFTMIATNVAILANGGWVVFADLGKNNLNISSETIKEKITRATKAIVVTLVAGIPTDLEHICNLGIPVIIDAAHAVDTYYKGKHISQWGDYVCFSFQSIKQLTTGDGGALVVKNDADYERGEKLKWFGISRKVPKTISRLQHQMTSDVTEWGYKFHMNDIAASIGLANLEILDDTVGLHRINATYYMKNLPPEMLLPVPDDSVPSWWVFPLLVENRNLFIFEMEQAGIETTPMWRRNDAYSILKIKYELPNMDAIQNKIVFIPCGWWVGDTERGHIVESIVRYHTSQTKSVV